MCRTLCVAAALVLGTVSFGTAENEALQTRPSALKPATIGLDWNDWMSLKESSQWGTIQSSFSPIDGEPVITRGGVRKTIGGLEYWDMQWVPEHPSSPEKTVLEFYAVAVWTPEPAIRIYVNGKRALRLSLANFEGGTVRDQRTGKQYGPWLVLPPGEYYLQATKPPTPAVTQPTTAPASTPAATQPMVNP